MSRRLKIRLGWKFGAKVILLVGERPGLRSSRKVFPLRRLFPRVATNRRGRDRTCISNIHQGTPAEAAAVIVIWPNGMLEEKASGIIT